ncbi:MAG: flagellar hook protein FlgE [Desulfuromonadaceae bacterium]|nr:flagellar hook protein FlgE [Desulfuromonas sp.]MDY0184995.1 flagellar hook protein FlgE [Desulfuromonadaceae bacterium]
MGIQSALYSGVSGLNANGNALTVIGNNIANSNTIGFKSGRTVFSDLMSASISGSGGTSQVGRGVGLSTVDNIFSQGTFENTESNTDLAIEGPGFFMVSDPTVGSTYYTRAGAFNFDEDGTLVSPEGYAVQGYYLNEDTGETIGDVASLKIETRSFSPARGTSQINLMTNLNANSPFLGKPDATTGDLPISPFSIKDPSETSNYASSVRVFDSLGREHLVTTYFNKLDPAGNPEGYMQWEAHTVVAGAEITLADGTAWPEDWAEVGRSVLTFDTGGRLVNTKDISGTIYGTTDFSAVTDPSIDGQWQALVATDRDFDVNGNLYVTPKDVITDPDRYPLTTDQEKIGGTLKPRVSTLEGAMAWNNESNAGQLIAFDFDATQYSSESDVISQSQNGFATGMLVSLSIDTEGNILGNYSNGEPRKLARIALAKFSNPLGLVKVGNNMYGSSDASGTPVIGTVGSGVGKIFTNSLEMSNVDLAQEFVKMITTQRGFQANSKIITTTDELLGELINLKR